MYTQHRFIFTSVHWYTTTICCTVLFKAQNTQVIYFHDQNILCKIPILYALLKKRLHHWSQTLKRPSTAMFFSAPVDIQHPWTTPFFQLDALKSTEIPVWQLVTAMHTSRDGERKCERQQVFYLWYIFQHLYTCVSTAAKRLSSSFGRTASQGRRVVVPESPPWPPPCSASNL